MPSTCPLRGDVEKHAVRYAGIRAEWALASSEERRAQSERRTRAHDALIEAFNILSLDIAKCGTEPNWRRDLGVNRKGIGDFACSLHCFLGLSAR